MPSIRHEAVVQLLRCNLKLAPYLLAGTGYKVPPGTLVQVDSNLSDPAPHEWRADIVTAVLHGARAGLAIVNEAQTSRPKRKKRRSWVGYVAVAGDEHDCDVVLLAIALSRDVARSCAKTFRTGHPGFDLTPIVSGPDNTPHPETPGAEEVSVELTVLNVLNGNFDLADAAVRAYVIGKLATATRELRTIYTRYIYRTVPGAVRQAMEEDVKTSLRVPFIDDAIEEGLAKGLAQGLEQGIPQGEGRMLLRMLAARGFVIPADIRELVEGCTDIEQLDRWGERAATAESLAEVFGDVSAT
jgi:hypothetical protein